MADECALIATETYGCRTLSSRDRTYMVSNSSSTVVISGRRENGIPSLLSQATEVFLPKGFPDSVSSDYLQYQMWDSLQAFCSSLNGTLATQAVLKGVGVGDESATVLGATITWLMKDGSSMVGRILFAWFKASELDSDSKKWRLFADIINNVAFFLDLLAPYFLSIFTPIICLSGVIRAIVGVAGGATRASLTQHQSRDNNIGDVSAKDGSQETLVNLMALICSLIILPVVVDNATLTWALFALFTIMHVAANYMAVSCICMESFNLSRYSILLSQYLTMGELRSIEQVNKAESVWIRLFPSHFKISLGVSLEELVSNKKQLEFLHLTFRGCKYVLNLSQHKRQIRVQIALLEDGDVQSQMEAVYQAILIQCALEKADRMKWQEVCEKSVLELESFQQLSKLCSNFTANKESIVKLSKRLMVLGFPEFIKKAECDGWDISKVLFNAGEFRFRWT